jgi:hypothetical protein
VRTMRGEESVSVRGEYECERTVRGEESVRGQ